MKTNKNEKLFEMWKTDSLRYSLSLPLYLIFLLLLWHWDYIIAFWIFLGLIVIEYLCVIVKMNKTKRKLFNKK